MVVEAAAVVVVCWTVDERATTVLLVEGMALLELTGWEAGFGFCLACFSLFSCLLCRVTLLLGRRGLVVVLASCSVLSLGSGDLLFFSDAWQARQSMSEFWFLCHIKLEVVLQLEQRGSALSAISACRDDLYQAGDTHYVMRRRAHYVISH